MANVTPIAARLDAARLFGAAVAAALGQAVVDDPAGVFGPQRVTTDGGTAFVLGVTLLAFLGIRERIRGGPAWALWATLQLVGTVSAFVVPLGGDPRIAGLVVLWQVWTASQLLFGMPRARVRGTAGDRPDAWLVLNGAAVRHLARLVGFAALSLGGYRVADSRFPTFTTIVLGLAVMVWARGRWKRWWQEGARVRPIGLGALLVGFAVAFALGNHSLAASLLGVGLWWLAMGLGSHPRERPSELIEAFTARPALLVTASFIVLILAGTLLLSLPAAAADGSPIALTDAVFTATSAVCVTGLIVLDTPNDFSTFGHVVLLILIQVGGLNIMVLSTFGAVLLGRSLGLRGERALAEMLETGSPSSAYGLIRFIVIVTVSLEALGAIALTPFYLERGESFGRALWLASFHAVSAFCNAGFALHSDSLMGFRTSAGYLATIAALITLGGLGFGVLAAAWQRIFVGGRRSPLEAHVALVVWMTAILGVVGAVWFAVVEWDGALAGLTLGDRLANAVFQSVTLRTAGFNSVDFAVLHPSTLVLMLVMMFIGASPGGTGGGIKTTTAAVLLAALPAIGRGRARLVLRRREIALETVYRSAALVVISTGTIVLASGLLLAVNDLSLEVGLFEVVSALGTVGLSIGGTAELDALGKMIIVAVMFLGRVGPLGLALLLGRGSRERVRYPEARVMVG
jgi:trk system potassium uptake protein TrkH